MESSPVSLAEWQAMFERIYGKRNEPRSSFEIWLHLVGRAGEVAEALRKEDREGLVENLPTVFAWLCAFCDKRGVSLEDLVWQKYPGLCPYCFREEGCICIAAGLKYNPTTKDLETARDQRSEMSSSLDGWQEMFGRIYGSVNKIKAQFQVGFHLFEEIGEVARAVLWPDAEDLSSELADVFAWTLGLASKARLKLSEITWQAYPGACSVCRQKECTCP